MTITSTGLYTVNLWMREDGLRIDRLLLTTDTTFVPTGEGPTETLRVGFGGSPPETLITRTIVYTYDNLYRLTDADYSTGENYQYSYDPVGNRLEQVINGDTTDYLYDAANRLSQVDSQSYTFDDNGNLLQTGVMTNVFDAANRLITSTRSSTVEPIYNGVNDRVGQKVDGDTTDFALDIAGGLPEVIYTSEGNAYLHLPGVIVAESAAGETRYLLSDGLGSVRHGVDEGGSVVAYSGFDPYGNPIQSGDDPYGFTGEWWEDDLELLHLRARWYAPYLRQSA
jgi:YD repeat-containing protein